MAHDFPGNIHELENILARSAALLDGHIIDTGNLELGDIAGSNSMDPQPADEAVAASAQDLPDITSIKDFFGQDSTAPSCVALLLQQMAYYPLVS